MKYDEYLKATKKEHDESEARLMLLAKEYASSNNTVKVGDIISDHIGKIKVEGILFTVRDVPSCVYQGVEYTKAGKPFKSGKRRDVWQSNLGR